MEQYGTENAGPGYGHRSGIRLAHAASDGARACKAQKTIEDEFCKALCVFLRGGKRLARAGGPFRMTDDAGQSMCPEPFNTFPCVRGNLPVILDVGPGTLGKACHAVKRETNVSRSLKSEHMSHRWHESSPRPQQCRCINSRAVSHATNSRPSPLSLASRPIQSQSRLRRAPTTGRGGRGYSKTPSLIQCSRRPSTRMDIRAGAIGDWRARALRLVNAWVRALLPVHGHLKPCRPSGTPGARVNVSLAQHWGFKDRPAGHYPIHVVMIRCFETHISYLARHGKENCHNKVYTANTYGSAHLVPRNRNVPHPVRAKVLSIFTTLSVYDESGCTSTGTEHQ